MKGDISTEDEITSDLMSSTNNELVLRLGLAFDLVFKWCSLHSAGNAVDIMLTHDHANDSSLFLYHIKSLAIFVYFQYLTVIHNQSHLCFNRR